MTHYWPSMPYENHGYGPDSVLLTFYILIGFVMLTHMFYIFYTRQSYKTLKKVLLQKGRLLQLVPIVTVSTIHCVQGEVQNVIQPVGLQASVPPNFYMAADGSRIMDNKVAPPSYVP